MWNPKKKNKYNAKKCKLDGYNFDSLKEMRFYAQLKIRQAAGEFKYFLRQVPIHLSPDVTYRVDFVIVDNDDKISFWEVKGFMTSTARVKISLAQEKLGAEINIV